jgi:hypothetical protein
MRRVVCGIVLSFLIVSCGSDIETVLLIEKDGTQFHYNTHSISFTANSNYDVIQSTDRKNPYITILGSGKDTF